VAVAIQKKKKLDCFALLAMTMHQILKSIRNIHNKFASPEKI